METIKASEINNKNNNSILKKTKNFFIKKRFKHSNNHNNNSFLNNKEDSYKTLIVSIKENNESNKKNLKQNKPEIINKETSIEENNTTEIPNDNNEDKNFESIQRNMNDLDKKINDINNAFNEKSNEWLLNHTEISERLNCLMWQMSQFHKEQIELSKKMKDEITDFKVVTINEVKETSKRMNDDITDFKDNITNEVKETSNLKEEINEIRKNIKNSNIENKNYMNETNDCILTQKSELHNLRAKLENMESEFDNIKEKVLSLGFTSSNEEVTPKKIDLNNCDDSLIEYITKQVQEKLENKYRFNELSKQQNQNLTKNLDIKINELSERLDEFQIYQLSREVEWHQMKIKLDNSMNQINKEYDQSERSEKDEFIEKWNNENNKIKETQEKINKAILELKSTLGDIKTNIYNTLNEQQDKIDDISKSTELLQKMNENDISNNDNIHNEITPNVSYEFSKIKHTIVSLTEDINMLNMETKMMTTNISLLWDDIRYIKNFIDQYDMKDKLKESETNEEFSEIYNQINNLKKKINENF